jgi:hypothetical protein
MSKFLQIKIPVPCHENWEDMNAVEKGRHCDACKKTVIDFSLMSDNDLALFFKKNKENVCGRFVNTQLNTDLRIPSRKIPWLKYFFTVSIPAFLFSFKGNSQAQELKGKVVCVEKNPEIKMGEIMVDTNRIIKGKVTDTDLNPVPFASIRIKGLKTGTAADSDGSFTIKLPPAFNILEISSLGFIPGEVDCRNANPYQLLNIKLEQEQQVTLGIVVISTPAKKPLPIMSMPDNLIFTLYPNPLPAFSRINIKWRKSVNSNQFIEIFDQSGNLVQQEVLTVKQRTSRQSIVLNQMAAGIYVVKITDGKSRAVSSQQIIVQ